MSRALPPPRRGRVCSSPEAQIQIRASPAEIAQPSGVRYIHLRPRAVSFKRDAPSQDPLGLRPGQTRLLPAPLQRVRLRSQPHRIRASRPRGGRTPRRFRRCAHIPRALPAELRVRRARWTVRAHVRSVLRVWQAPRHGTRRVSDSNPAEPTDPRPHRPPSSHREVHHNDEKLIVNSTPLLTAIPR